LTDRQFFLLAVIAYGVSMVFSVFVWRKNFQSDNRVNYALLMVGLVFHTVALAKRGFSLERCPVNNLFEATAFFLWTFVVVYAVLGVFSRLRFLGAFAAPIVFCVGVFSLMPALDSPPGAGPRFSGAWVSLHATLILLSYGALGLGSAAAAMYLTQEHDLKLHKIKAILSRLPSIERIEKVVQRLTLTGFTLLTAGLAIIPIKVGQPEGVSFAGDLKVLWSLLVWVIYSLVVLAHFRFHFVGKRFAWSVVALFIFVLLTFWGTNLMSPVHN